MTNEKLYQLTRMPHEKHFELKKCDDFVKLSLREFNICQRMHGT